jgi:hypothetical protein
MSKLQNKEIQPEEGTQTERMAEVPKLSPYMAKVMMDAVIRSHFRGWVVETLTPNAVLKVDLSNWRPDANRRSRIYIGPDKINSRKEEPGL